MAHGGFVGPGGTESVVDVGQFDDPRRHGDLLAGGGLLDVLPEGASKRAAVEHLRVVLGLEPDGVVFAGDSGNDEEALLAGWGGIVVGNAPPELKTRLARAASQRGLDGQLFFARAGCTAGVLEGARHFGLFPAAS